jgi:hypothetical protein
MRFVYKKRTGQPWDKPGHDEKIVFVTAPALQRTTP